MYKRSQKKPEEKIFSTIEETAKKEPEKETSETVLLSRFSRAQELVLIKNLVFILPSSWLFPEIMLKGRIETVIYRWKRPTCCTTRCKTDQKLISVCEHFLCQNTSDLHIKETLVAQARVIIWTTTKELHNRKADCGTYFSDGENANSTMGIN